MKRQLKANRERLLSEIQLTKQRLYQAPLQLRQRWTILGDLRHLEKQLEMCEATLRSL